MTVMVSLVPFAGSLIDVVERLTVRVMFSPAELRRLIERLLKKPPD